MSTRAVVARQRVSTGECAPRDDGKQRARRCAREASAAADDVLFCVIRQQHSSANTDA